jgi:hypothetical protein
VGVSPAWRGLTERWLMIDCVWRLARYPACALLAVGLAGCGYVQLTIWIGDDADDISGQMIIDSPTSTAQWETSGSTITLGGRSFVPAGSTCTGDTGVVASGYRVAWLNTSTGVTGIGESTLQCLPVIELRWTSGPVPLNPGSNPVVVSTTDSSGRSASDTLTVQRR